VRCEREKERGFWAGARFSPLSSSRRAPLYSCSSLAPLPPSSSSPISRRAYAGLTVILLGGFTSAQLRPAHPRGRGPPATTALLFSLVIYSLRSARYPAPTPSKSSKPTSTAAGAATRSGSGGTGARATRGASLSAGTPPSPPTSTTSAY